MPVAPRLQAPSRADRADQQHRRQQHQAGVADRTHQKHAEQRPDESADACADCHQGKQPLGFCDAEQIRQYAPAHRNGEQIEHRQPDVKRASQPGVVRAQLECQREQRKVRREEPQRPCEHVAARGARRQPAEQRHCRERRDERAGEQPLQILHAAGNAHGLAHRAAT
jgi:hypothetical protein